MSKTKTNIRWLLALVLAVLLIAGLLLGQTQAVFAYAWPICLPCIGIQ